ncbi:MAG: 5-formyltetrahydrofolate cyclo-ligase [Gammaproteobacteria bacterium]|nr:5-formyltetrahydrofolate cyclo-ligase [Gammaproteobacteria bacterium]
MNNKSQLRAEFRAQRAALTSAQQEQASRQAALHLTASRWFRTSRHIACYIAHNGEIDVFPIIEKIWQMNKVCYLPVVSHLSWDHLWFTPFEPDTPFVLNRYGIPEPDIERRHWIRAQLLDLVLMPLVAFDLLGNRIGMGAGFYDRSLAFLQRRNHWRRPHLVGLAHDFQKVENIQPEPWDVALQGVVTDKRFYTIAG